MSQNAELLLACMKEDPSWWRHQMENLFRVTGPLCGEFTGPGEFPTQMPVTRSFDVFFDLRLNKRLSKRPRGWWFETQSWSLWRHSNVITKSSSKNTNVEIYIYCITWWCNLIRVSIGLTFKTAFYGESDVIYFKFENKYYGDPILC